MLATRYYSLFIATNLAAAVFYFFFLPETVRADLQQRQECMLIGSDFRVASRWRKSLLCSETKLS